MEKMIHDESGSLELNFSFSFTKLYRSDLLKIPPIEKTREIERCH
jgi:hypothetical protein